MKKNESNKNSKKETPKKNHIKKAQPLKSAQIISEPGLCRPSGL